MKQSELFTKTSKVDPKDEISTSAKLLIRAGFIDKLSAGIYSFLPLGLRVLAKIQNIIREEMNVIGGQEILMPALHPKESWLPTGRWEVPEMFKVKSRSGRQYGLGWTHEEIITPLVKKFIGSYKDLPKYVYQIQDKLRDELRAKSGLLRTKEFIMKDLYSFHATASDLDDYYEKATEAYFKIFERSGLLDQTYLTLASGGAFSKYSDEFQTTTEAGEDLIYICPNCDRAVNKEIKDEFSKCPECGGQEFKQAKAIEVGNIFKLGTRYSEAFDLKFKDRDGSEKPVIMGCYGIGPSRVMGTIIEIFHDERGMIWPEEVAPFAVHLLKIKNQSANWRTKIKNIDKISEKIYEDLKRIWTEVLYDDREVSSGEKFADADLIGCPQRIIISEKTLAKDCVEVKKRNEKKAELVKINKLLQFLNI